ncbi:hypothetical protein [Roseomonas indoligenes]|uniref:Uncharacterized protein n=1 Tax=Roseomonas indoligenes TaxID=2820811 RepID=A0A940S615_9PROT|nr:hypothetical protein [Pararoseomonas indoligenes]MBP0493574.1 hypothetical protein [Pararoseomonas indoligenes]
MSQGSMMRSGLAAPLALALLLPPLAPAARAQGEVRSVVVPAEGAVVIPPRSAPRLAARPAGTGVGVPIPPGASRSPVFLPDAGTGLAAPVLGLALPAIAGALLGGSIAGSRSGSSAPARTR